MRNSNVFGVGASNKQQYVRFSDIVANQAIDDLRAETTDVLGESMGNSYDQLTRAVYNAGTTVNMQKPSRLN